MTKQAIREGFEQLRPGDRARSRSSPRPASRSEADWLVGMNATRAATIRGRAWVGGVVSLGRVQTPTLAIIVAPRARDPGLRPRAVLARRTRASTRATRASGSTRSGPTTRTRRPARRPGSRRPSVPRRSSTKVSGKTGTVEDVERKEQSERAPLLYDLTSLQRDANTPLRLLRAPHARRPPSRCYEGKKAITYPRTSSRWLSGDLVPQLKPTAATLVDIPEYAAAAQFVLRLDSLPLARVVNDAKVDDHHAIIPTDVEHDVSEFSPDERRIFDLVARRFLAVFHPPARYARTTRRHRRRGRALPHPRQGHARGRAGAASTAAARPTTDTERGRRERRAAAAREGPGGQGRLGRERGQGDEAAARATPRRRCSPRWRPPASSSTTRSCARR